MKKTLLALTLLAFTGTAAFAHEGNDGKKDGKKKEGCATEAKSHCSGEKGGLGSTPSCCMKKKTAASTTPATAPAVKAL